MRVLGCTAAVVPLLVSLMAAPSAPVWAQADPYAMLPGHWSCTLANGRHAERSYFSPAAARGRTSPGEIVGRQDTVEPDGSPVGSFERIAPNPDGSGHSIEAVEGRGTSAGSAAPLRFSLRAWDDETVPVSLTYEVADNTLRRTATRASATVADERCTREPEPPADPNCTRPNVPAATLHAVQPTYPEAAAASRAQGEVYVVVTLDDRSRVLWARVVRSPSVLLNDASVIAARESTYRAEIRNCRPVAGEYIFSLEYRLR